MRLTDSTSNKSEGLSEYSLTSTISTQSKDILAPRWGPEFLRSGSLIYRLEMLIITIGLLVLLFCWRLIVVKDLNLPVTVFWMIWPDIGSFIPIGLVARGKKNWPTWGPALYNFWHTFLVWMPVFAIWSLVTSTIEWPLLGWAAHITLDRTVGYYLRATTSTIGSKAIV